MKLDKKEAMRLLDEARPLFECQDWIDHCVSVGTAAGRIAERLKDKGIDIDVDKAITCGYIHDIGKVVDNMKQHISNGYKFMKEKKYEDDEIFCNVILTHSFLNNDIRCTAGWNPEGYIEPELEEFIKNHKNTIYDELIMLCDLMCTKDIVTIEKRLIDIIIRKGAYSNTQYHIRTLYKLKEKFENMMGCDLYEIFPELKD